MFDRDSAFSIEISDPDAPEVQHQITYTLSLDGQLIIFSKTAIFKLLTADVIDPDKQSSDTRHSYEKIYSIGANNFLVARTIIQFNGILNLVILDGSRKELLLNRVWNCTKILLECEKSHYYIYNHTIELMPKCDKIIENNKNKSSIPALPKIPDLQTYVSDFLMNGKLFLIETYRFLNEFYNMPFDDRNAAHFNKHRKWIEGHLGENHPLYQLLRDDEEWIRIISECSNAIRHPEEGQRVDIENISLKPGNKFSGPAWKYGLSKKGLAVQNDYTDLIHNFSVYQHNLATLFEEVLILSIQDFIKDSSMFAVFKKRPDQISKDCPVLYEVNLKQPLISD